MWAWLGGLNPLQWLTLIRDLFRYAIVFGKWLQRKIRLEKEHKNLDQIQKAEDKLSEANKIKDDQQRLEEKANAAKDLENSLSDSTR